MLTDIKIRQAKGTGKRQQLAHAVKEQLGRAYNRTKHLKERRKMMQQWADYLDELKRQG